MNESTHSINLLASSKLSIESNIDSKQHKKAIIEQETINVFSNNLKLSSSQVSSFSELEVVTPTKLISNYTLTTTPNHLEPTLNEQSFRRRNRQIKQIQNMISDSATSRNNMSHFSPKPSVRIKIIDETDTDT